jgi:two-component system, NarL family, nitrate/nitrite response regulator NarL
MSSLVTSVAPGVSGALDEGPECRASDANPADTRRRVLVIDGDLLIAEAIASALTQATFAARFAMPISTAHVRDLTGWRPGLALLNVDTVDPAVATALVAMLVATTVPVAILTSHLDRTVVGECIDLGASTVVDKASGLEELVRVITHVLEGRVVFDEEAKRRLLESVRRQARAQREQWASFDVLTHREKCVLAELMDGHAPEAIARRRSVSILTVRSQIKAILQKLGVNSQLAAVSLARRAGWTFEDPAPHEPPSSRGLPADRLGQSA